eukprot:TRINITY_DN5637_c0_g1_i1.p1 TRINITY_DN5637_c0_g1~~TRINITY_DN5637_c0_g1_i1.p1  ORF type:complete len:548 (+),score=101.95 TRINITY_DN5637_c0_g1_i1:55-1644(+)
MTSAETPEVLDVEKQVNSKGADGISWYVVFVCGFVASTGLFHGYDNGIVSDVMVMPSFRTMMGWPAEDDSQIALLKSLTVNGFNLGAFISAIASGHLLVDRYGRRPGLIIGSLLFAVGGLVQAASVAVWMLILGRFIAGIGVGMTCVAGPSYISEIAPAKIRGAMVGIYQSNVCLAIVFSPLINAAVFDVANGWRWSLGIQVIMGAAGAIGMTFMSETPRFLESSGRSEAAFKVLSSLRGGNGQVAEAEMEQVRADISEEKQAGSASWLELFTTPLYRNVVLIGCSLQFLQIFTGINALVSFGGTLYHSLGISPLVGGLTGNLLFFIGNAVGAFKLADWVGRRPLMVWGMVFMAVSLLISGITTLVAPRHTSPDGEEHIASAAGYVIVAMVASFMLSFGLSWGFGAWLYIAEIMPLRVRGKAFGLAAAANWGPANFFTAFAMPMMIASWGPGVALLFFGIVSSLTVPYAMTCIAETKGRTLEELAPLFDFKDCRGFARYVRGNLKGGYGCEDEQAHASKTSKMTSVLEA